MIVDARLTKDSLRAICGRPDCGGEIGQIGTIWEVSRPVDGASWPTLGPLRGLMVPGDTAAMRRSE